jgi:hypothetical protein
VSGRYELVRVLILVMTYPLPSRGYRETICTGGITEAGEWVRLYPIDYRYRPMRQQFRKYQWIEVELADRGTKNDKRKESRSPKLESIRMIGEPLSTKNNWRDRKEHIDKLPVSTVHELKLLYEKERVSLGIVKPTKVLDLTIELSEREWKSEWDMALRQFNLFGPPPKPLKKIPYKFSYVFECADSTKPHNAMIEDWELGVLYLKEVNRLGSEEKAAESVKNKYLKELCSENRDTHFFMGTTFPFNSWVVLGAFYPKIEKQVSLF